MQGTEYPAHIFEVASVGAADAQRAVSDAMVAIRDQAFPWFEQNLDLDRAYMRLKSVCWYHAKDPMRRPDAFFSDEDLFAALAIRTGRTEGALELFRAIAARPVESAERAAYDKQEARRQRRIARATSSQVSGKARSRPLLTESVAFWRDGATERVRLLEGFMQEGLRSL